MTVDDWFLQRARVTSKSHRRITMDDKMTFFQQLSSLVTSGTPLMQSLELCAEQTLSTRLAEIVRDLAACVAGGSTLQAAMSQHPNVFEPHWTALIGTGEVSGKMGQVLTDLNEQIRESRETSRKVTGSLIYPIILLIVAILVVVIMLWFVVPTFAGMFEEMNAELPRITQFVINASDYIAKYGVFIFAGIGALVYAFRRYMRTEAGRRRVVSIGLSLPLVGDLMVQAAMYRFASNLSLLLRSGVPMLDTLTALSTVFRANPVYRDAILQTQSRVAAGRPLADSLESSQLFTTMMTHMVLIGEESSQLANVMDELAPYYKDKMNGFISKVTKLLEPCIIMFMGGVIAVVMLAIYIPMFEMSGKVN
ncbi:MAG: type II secretion system F family protein [Planctomycetales bacterium]|nr:type II secretion system F family protein [Planctomycetales bacterium]